MEINEQLDNIAADFSLKAKQYSHDSSWLAHYFRDKIEVFNAFQVNGAVKEYKEEIVRVRPLAECYERALKTFGLEKNLIGYVLELKEEIKHLKEKSKMESTTTIGVRAHVSQPLQVQNIRTLFKAEQELLKYAMEVLVALADAGKCSKDMHYSMANSFLEQKMQEKLLFACPIQE